MRTLAIAVLGISVALGHATAQSTAPSKFVGCYTFDTPSFGIWRNGRSDSTQMVRLTADSVPSPFGARWRATTVPPPTDARQVDDLFRAFSEWRVAGSDSIAITISNGLHGWGILLRAQGDTLRGVWGEISDVIGAPRKQGTALAVRAACPGG